MLPAYFQKLDGFSEIIDTIDFSLFSNTISNNTFNCIWDIGYLGHYPLKKQKMCR